MARSDEFRLLILADIHHGRMAEAGLDFLPKRWPSRALELIRWATGEAAARGKFDCIALMGDLVEDGRLDDVDERLAEVRDAIQACAPGAATIVVPGNHDYYPEKVFAAFGARGGLHEIGGYRFVVLVDEYDDSEVCTRPADQQQILADVARNPGGPIVVLQHNPMNPYIESDYPFMMTNRQEIMRDYSRWGVWLCIGAHYHRGQPISEADGVLYFTAPALCEEPFCYTLMTLRPSGVSVEMGQLQSPGE